jgi:capsular polysaccharide biosynthesis protein
MEVVEILRTLRSKRLATLLVVVAAFAAAVAVRISSHNVPTGASTVQLLVDSPSSELANLSQNPTPLISRAGVFAQVMTSQAVLHSIAVTAGVPEREITAQGPYSGSAESQDTIVPAEARSNQLVAEHALYRLSFVAQLNEPVITASVQAPTPEAAAKVADAIYPGVQRYVQAMQHEGHTPEADRVTLRALGPAQSGSVNGHSRATIMVAAFLAILILGLLSILGLESVRRRDRELEQLDQDLEAHLESVAQSTPAARSLASAGERRR